MTAENRQSFYSDRIGSDPAVPAKRARESARKSTGRRAQANVGTPRLLTRGFNIYGRNRRCIGADSHKDVHSRRHGIGRPDEVGHKRPPAFRVSLAGIFRLPAVARGLSPLRFKQRRPRSASNITLGRLLLDVSFFEDNAVLRDLELEEKGAERYLQGRVPGIQTLCEPWNLTQQAQCVTREKIDGISVKHACQLVSASTRNMLDTLKPKSKERKLVVDCFKQDQRTTYGSVHGHFPALHLAPV